jgi:serine phosphatase RsbU (regulator of sigma subunit)/anti-sigma regulatory factor (Ser/Thr protein kinase)/tetratricopeptide (TPR) repeat protein
LFRKISKEQLRVPAHIDYLAELREFISEIGKKYRLPDSMVKSFKLAIDEAATNIIRYAYRDIGEEGIITLRVIVRKESVTVCMIDQGQRFDPRNVKEPDLDRYVKIGKKGGLGIFIIRKLMDKIEYRTTSEGNELRLTKNREAIAGSRMSRFMPGGFKAMTFGMKTRFWARTSFFLAIATAGYFFYHFWGVDGEILNRKMPGWSEIADQISRTLAEDKTILEDLTGGRVNQLLSSLISKRTDEIYEVALVDSTGEIQGDSELIKTFLQYDFAPLDDENRLSENLSTYHIIDDSQAGSDNLAIFDYFPLVEIEHPAKGKLTLHLRIFKNHVDELIAAEKWLVGRNSLLLFGGGCIGAFLLIYLLMNPLRKLTEFVRSGGEVEIQDDIEIDPSSEVGEIAKAFSDITARFRESQRNLADQERLQQEMHVAKEIQQTLLPHEFPDLEGYEISGHYESAELVGGDYYDFIDVDRDTIGIVVADVSGKGVPGSIVMTMIRQALRTEARGVKNAAEVLSRLNDLVVGDMRKGMFVTVFYVIIDSKKRRLNFASAGHNPMILYRGTTQKTYYLNPRGFPIGIELPEKDLFRESIESDTIQLFEDDLVLIYTDGITEAMDDMRELFGEERLLDTIRGHGTLRASPFTEKLSEAIQSFTRGHPQSDDITFVTIREKSTLQKEELRRATEAYRMILSGTSIRTACEEAGISTFAYYNKYKKTFEEEGIESYALDDIDSLEARHIAIEDKAKIFDIIKNHPEYGPKRLSDELNTEKYAWTDIPENKIYDELVRNRLNTRQLREAYVARAAHQRRRQAFKMPGTPLLTLDGRVIKSIDQEQQYKPFKAQPVNGFESKQQPEQPDPVDEHVPDVPEPSQATHFEIIEDEDRDLIRDSEKEKTEELPAQPESPEESQESTKENFPGIDDLLHEEIEKTFSDAYASIEEQLAEQPPESPDEAGTEKLPESEQDENFEESNVFIASIDELLNEDVLDSTTVSMDGEIDVQTGIDSILKASDADLPEEVDTVTNDNEDEDKNKKTATHQTSEVFSRKKSLLFREQQMTKGYRFYKAQQYKEAIKEFEKVVADFPGYKKAYKILANAYFRVDRYKDAIKTYHIVKEKDPDDPAAYENLGIAYIKLGEIEEAMKEWRDLLEVAPYRHDIREKLEALQAKAEQASDA